jgi:hypothetical protein
MDLSDLRQLEALLGAGPKQPIYSQAVNDNLFPLSELEEEAATLVCIPRSFAQNAAGMHEIVECGYVPVLGLSSAVFSFDALREGCKLPAVART